MNRSNRSSTGFTLVELLIVVIILGILAAIVIPQFRSAASESAEAALMADLNRVRKAIELYRVQHDDGYPGASIVDQLTLTTDASGSTSGTRFGPYLRAGFPANPVDDDATVTTGTSLSTPGAASSGWAYDTSTGEFRANTPGTGPSGTDYFDL